MVPVLSHLQAQHLVSRVETTQPASLVYRSGSLWHLHFHIQNALFHLPARLGEPDTTSLLGPLMASRHHRGARVPAGAECWVDERRLQFLVVESDTTWRLGAEHFEFSAVAPEADLEVAELTRVGRDHWVVGEQILYVQLGPQIEYRFGSGVVLEVPGGPRSRKVAERWGARLSLLGGAELIVPSRSVAASGILDGRGFALLVDGSVLATESRIL